MSAEVLILALLVGAANWAFRVLPMRIKPSAMPPDGPVARFLAATGPAAIATLFVASVLPALYPVPKDVLTLGLGTVAVVAVFLARRSVVAATLAGAAVHGMAVWALA